MFISLLTFMPHFVCFTSSVRLFSFPPTSQIVAQGHGEHLDLRFSSKWHAMAKKVKLKINDKILTQESSFYMLCLITIKNVSFGKDSSVVLFLTSDEVNYLCELVIFKTTCLKWKEFTYSPLPFTFLVRYFGSGEYWDSCY